MITYGRDWRVYYANISVMNNDPDMYDVYLHLPSGEIYFAHCDFNSMDFQQCVTDDTGIYIEDNGLCTVDGGGILIAKKMDAETAINILADTNTKIKNPQTWSNGACTVVTKVFTHPSTRYESKKCYELSCGRYFYTNRNIEHILDTGSFYTERNALVLGYISYVTLAIYPHVDSSADLMIVENELVINVLSEYIDSAIC